MGVVFLTFWQMSVKIVLRVYLVVLDLSALRRKSSRLCPCSCLMVLQHWVAQYLLLFCTGYDIAPDPWIWAGRSTHFLSTACLGHAGLFTFAICGNFSSFCLTQKCPRTHLAVGLPSLRLTHRILVVHTVISPCGRCFCGAMHLYVPPGFPEAE